MSKITSWDKTVRIDRFGVAYELTEAECADYYPDGNGPKGRLNLWPEGAPDPSEVPHAGEEVRTDTGSIAHEIRHGIPEHVGGSWNLKTVNGLSLAISRLTRVSDAPTVKIGEKTYNLADAVARCEPLEEVS